MEFIEMFDARFFWAIAMVCIAAVIVLLLGPKPAKKRPTYLVGQRPNRRAARERHVELAIKRRYQDM